ncbi:SDR family NAD(P)-dependent oxidoreductase [Pseudomonas sp. PA-6-1D]|jgi:NAD(P)-dependent dehydrogenase (short-subunit alcohol dehydrogenase family)|uniref:SDR family NAD(P)-dependent oxidoreductase n=1 Tax=Pseudomonas TaxID=286 RepID=UPI001EF05F3E|nr:MULTISPECIES: SDR family oxidoreductase [Pseudomonas]MCF5142800.1 SDR family NAD(P)-dependent oxidoreductase [Pseudomonas sp. PA-6-3C]MCF5150286.1 SDR family NAD(P)-dependent oxidoreductase [Pseudomonas sp. PA-6-3F]MCF5162335.1 SDR family NAD(P)-dependent oxidoreductase [Pseudomonas sp. PA-6-2E]MCF5177965.1 SDR family NAD(P)-dependent oxidoreductase [Pseudomonas sp. PA-6-1D]MCF5193448.1 SDR family NAD(P)-dependent oxidoreductase [Pseudomonas sp. PA-6-1H]
MDFTGKTAIITGGARGLGLSYARALAQGGARVVISDIGANKVGVGTDASVVHAAAAALQAEGLAVLGHGGDLSTDEGCRQLISFTIEAYGQLDILIHNAGWVGYQNIADLDAAFLQRTMDINLYAPLWLCKHAWPHLLRSAAPRIILTTSDRAMYVEYEQTGLVAYSAGKMAQLGIMNALSHEGAEAGINVNAISPVAKTRMWGVTDEPDELKPEWVTPGVVFLASGQCQDTGYILRASNGQFTATRFTENPGVEYPRNLARIKAANAQEVAAAWSRIKQPLAQAGVTS